MTDDYDVILDLVRTKNAEIKRLEAEVKRLRCCQNCKYITSKGECVHGLNEWNETLCGHYETDALTSEDRK